LTDYINDFNILCVAAVFYMTTFISYFLKLAKLGVNPTSLVL